MKLVKGDILEFTRGKSAYSASDGAKAIYQGEKYTDQDGGEVISIKWIRNGDDNGQIDGGYFLSMFTKVEEVSTQKEDRIFEEIKKEKVMKDLRFNFKEGKTRVIDMLNDHTSSFKADMAGDIKIILNRGEEDAIDQVEEIIKSIRMNTNYHETAIDKVKQASTVAEVLKAMHMTVYEEMEEAVLNELFGLESVTRED